MTKLTPKEHSYKINTYLLLTNVNLNIKKYIFQSLSDRFLYDSYSCTSTIANVYFAVYEHKGDFFFTTYTYNFILYDRILWLHDYIVSALIHSSNFLSSERKAQLK